MTKRRNAFFLVLWLFSACMIWGAIPLFAQETPSSRVTADETSVGDAKQALGKSPIGFRQYPWYSDETDSADFVPFPKEPNRNPTPAGWGDFGLLLAKMGYWAVLGIAILVIAFLLVLAWYLIYRNQDLFHRLWKKDEHKERQRRIETLPEEARDVFDDLIGAAKRAFESGQYRLALIFYFSHQLVWLDMHQLIRMHKGKTNHEYARELKQAVEVLAHYEKSMSLFEAVYYGDHPITRLQFLALWEYRNDFSQAVKSEKQRRDEGKLNRAYGSSLAAQRGNLTLTVDMPDADKPDENGELTNNDNGDTNKAADERSHRSRNELPFQSPSAGLMLMLACLAVMSLGMTGCWRIPVQTSYVPPPGLDKSINGISVFDGMIEKQGHALRSGMRANSYARNGDVVVWFARQTGCPEGEAVRQIEQWLEEKPGRTFVYVGRAYESTYDYWEAVEPLAPTDDDRRRISERKQDAAVDLRDFLAKPGLGKQSSATAPSNADKLSQDESDNGTDHANKTDEKADHKKASDFDWEYGDYQIGLNTKCDWFEASLREKAYYVTDISGDADWTQNIDAEKLHLIAYEDWQFADDIEPLLLVKGETIETPGDFRKTAESADKPADETEQTFVGRKKVGESQIIFVNNAGFLLNYPLVNHEHRKLAGRLIDTFGEPKKRTFMYIGYSQIDFKRAGEVSDASPHVLVTLLHIWPISVILFHAIVLCAIFCFYKWPIFGRPQKLPEIQVTDFGKHIDACAELLAEAKDDEYVLKQIAEAYTNNSKELGR